MLDMLSKNKSIEEIRLPLVLSDATQQQGRIAKALRSRPGLRWLELTIPRPKTDWSMLLDVIKSCPCLERLVLSLAGDVTVS